MRHLSPALVLAIIAIVLATTAGATAATTLITGKQIKDSTITGKDIKNSTIGSADIKGSAIGTPELADDVIRRIFRDPTPGPAGPAGPAGATGPAGPQAIATVRRFDAPTTSQGAYGSGSEVQVSVAYCPSGSYATGGSYIGGFEDLISYTRVAYNSYSVIAFNQSTETSSIAATVVCVSGSGVTAASAHHGVPAHLKALVRKLQRKVNARH